MKNTENFEDIFKWNIEDKTEEERIFDRIDEMGDTEGIEKLPGVPDEEMRKLTEVPDYFYELWKYEDIPDTLPEMPVYPLNYSKKERVSQEELDELKSLFEGN